MTPYIPKKDDIVTTENYSSITDGKELEVENVLPAEGHSGSGYLVKVIGITKYIDSSWIKKIK